MRPLLRLIVLLALVSAACGGPSRSPFLSEGRDLYRTNACVTCHGGGGEGGVGPALSDVAATFPGCEEQVTWVTLGSEGWRTERGDTYGAQGKELKGGMRAFGDQLSDEEIRTVVSYERIEFGGLDEAAVRADCGI